MLKRRKIVMVSIETPKKIKDGDLYIDQYGKLCIVDDRKSTHGWSGHTMSQIFTNMPTLFKYTYQKIYILSSEQIMVGDWVFDNGGVYCINDKNHLLTLIEIGNPEKIIATTDVNINEPDSSSKDITYGMLPQPSQSFLFKFIDRYNSKQPIAEVMVEYKDDAYCNSQNCTCNDKQVIDCLYGGNKLKVAEDNTITIRPIKEIFDKNDLYELAMWMKHTEFNIQGYSAADCVSKWIEEVEQKVQVK